MLNMQAIEMKIKITIYKSSWDDTEIYILLCSIAYYCQSVLHFRQGTSSTKTGITYHSVSALASELGEVICEVLPSLMLSLGLIPQVLFIVAQKYKASKKMLSQPLTTKLISSISSKRAIIAQVTDLFLHVVYNRPKIESHPGKVDTQYYLSQKERRKNSSRLNFWLQMNSQYI